MAKAAHTNQQQLTLSRLAGERIRYDCGVTIHLAAIQVSKAKSALLDRYFDQRNDLLLAEEKEGYHRLIGP